MSYTVPEHQAVRAAAPADGRAAVVRVRRHGRRMIVMIIIIMINNNSNDNSDTTTTTTTTTATATANTTNDNVNDNYDNISNTYIAY